jgi:multiple sugar transport system substrate-binding protein
MSDWSAADLNYEITNYLPARKSTYTLYNIFNTYPMNIFAEQLFTTASPRPRTPAYLEYEEILREAYSNVINGADAAAELNRAAMLIEKVLQRYTR